jgi:hypothetical protein
MPTITKASYAGGHRVELVFDSGERGIVDLGDLVHRHLAAAPLRDPAAFAAFQLDDWPTLAWPCGFDVAPERLYELATGKTPAWATI